MKKRNALVLGLVLTALSRLTAVPVESNKEVASVQAPPEKDWSFNVSIYGWATAIDGTISAGGRSADVDIAFKDVLKHLDMTFMGAAELRYKRWGFMGDLVYARLSDDIAPPAGIVFSSTHEVVKETIGTFLLSYRVVDAKPTYLDLFAGARVYSFYSQIVLRPNLGQRGVNVDGTTTWADPIVGLGGRYYVSPVVFQKVSPQTDEQRAAKSQALEITVKLGQMYRLLFQQAGTSIYMPLLIVVVSWLAMIFLSFGLFTPHNATAIMALTASAVSVCAAIFLLLELDQPFSGLIGISSEPMRNAPEHIGR